MKFIQDIKNKPVLPSWKFYAHIKRKTKNTNMIKKKTPCESIQKDKHVVKKEKKHQTIITVGKQRRLTMINTGECMRSGSVSSSCMLPAMLLSQINAVSELHLLISDHQMFMMRIF